MKPQTSDFSYGKRELNFRVKGLKVYRDFDSRSLVPGSKGYLKAVFEFDESWYGLTKLIAFYDEQGREYPFVLEDNSCDIPDEATAGSRFSLKLVGLGYPNIKLQTSKITVYQKGGN